MNICIPEIKMETRHKNIFILLLIAGIPILYYTIYRDIQIEKQYCCDFRNRIVGARLIKDGKLPYFYKVKKEDGLRYYLPPANESIKPDTLKANNITASPFFHHLLYSLTEFQQSISSKIWLVLEYIMLLLICLLTISFAKTYLQRISVLITALLFIYTKAWIMHIAAGQFYVLIPLLALMFYWCFQQKENKIYAFFTGIVCVSLVLIKPNAILFFLPFLYYAKRYKKTTWLFFLIPFVAAIVFLITPNERKLWIEYYRAINETIQLHQGLDYVKQYNKPYPAISNVEGIDMNEVHALWREHPVYFGDENANFFYLFKAIFHKKVPLWLLNILSVLSISLLAFLYFLHHKKNNAVRIQQLAIAAYCMYMLSDLFSPVYRHQYYTVQWLFPILIFASIYQSKYKWFAVLFFIGLMLNITSIRFIPMRHTIGEYLILLTSLMFIFTTSTLKNCKKAHADLV